MQKRGFKKLPKHFACIINIELSTQEVTDFGWKHNNDACDELKHENNTVQSHLENHSCIINHWKKCENTNSDNKLTLCALSCPRSTKYKNHIRQVAHDYQTAEWLLKNKYDKQAKMLLLNSMQKHVQVKQLMTVTLHPSRILKFAHNASGIFPHYSHWPYYSHKIIYICPFQKHLAV